MSARGRFVTLEGIEGVGKSTQVPWLAEDLRALGHTVTVTREPGGTPLGEALRSLILDARAEAMAEDTELLLMFAARAEHLARVVRPALDRGEWVVCDRFTDATYAYQGAGRGVAAERIRLLEDWVQGTLRPDLTLLLDAPVEQALARTRGRDDNNRFEDETAHFFERVRAGYRDLAEQEPARVRVIDATRPLDAVRAAIRAELQTVSERR